MATAPLKMDGWSNTASARRIRQFHKQFINFTISVFSSPAAQKSLQSTLGKELTPNYFLNDCNNNPAKIWARKYS